MKCQLVFWKTTDFEPGQEDKLGWIKFNVKKQSFLFEIHQTKSEPKQQNFIFNLTSNQIDFKGPIKSCQQCPQNCQIK